MNAVRDPSALARGGMTAVRRRESLHISIAIASLDGSTIVFPHIGNDSSLRRNRKTAVEQWAGRAPTGTYFAPNVAPQG